MTVKMIALQAFTYAGHALKVGDPFEADSDGHARLLQGLSRAAIVREEPTAGVQTPKRRYKRRDLAAES